jgi:hypothetical protein
VFRARPLCLFNTAIQGSGVRPQISYLIMKNFERFGPESHIQAQLHVRHAVY